MHDQSPGPLQLSGPSLPATRDPEFALVRRGYDRSEVDAHIGSLRRRIDELEARIDQLEVMNSANAAVHQALERVGEEVTGILQTAHETANAITHGSQREADDRIRVATAEAAGLVRVANDEAEEVTARAEQRVRELDLDTEAILGERERIVDDARELARQLLEMAQSALDRFPPSLGRGDYVEGE